MNPKLIGANIIDCIPIPGKCPNNCNPCFYNEPGFYHDINIPLLPTLEEVGTKIVRVNSGRDSTIDFDQVIELTKIYPKKFYNTSLPGKILDFPSPVVFTCNSKSDKWYTSLFKPDNLMAIRVRTTTWNTKLVDDVVDHYTKLEIPVILTFLFYSEQHIGNSFNKNDIDKYEKVKHITNERYFIKPLYWLDITSKYKNNSNVYTCGTINSPLCKYCRNCEKLYEKAIMKFGMVK